MAQRGHYEMKFTDPFRAISKINKKYFQIATDCPNERIKKSQEIGYKILQDVFFR